ARNRTAFARSAHPFEHEPLVRRVLVDDDQSILRLGDNVGGCKLSASYSERESRNRLDRRLCACDGGLGEKTMVLLYSQPRESGSSDAFRNDGIPGFAGMTN